MRTILDATLVVMAALTAFWIFDPMTDHR